MSLRISSWNLNMMRWRVAIGVFRHTGKARFAANTAALNSSFVVKGTWETTSCVACHEGKQNILYSLKQQHNTGKRDFKSIYYTYRIQNINRGKWLWINKSTANEIGNPLIYTTEWITTWYKVKPPSQKKKKEGLGGTWRVLPEAFIEIDFPLFSFPYCFLLPKWWG